MDQGVFLQPTKYGHLDFYCCHSSDFLRCGGQEREVVDEQSRPLRAGAYKAQSFRVTRKRDRNAALEGAPHHHRVVAIEELPPFAVHTFLDTKLKRIARSPALRLKH